MVCVEGILGSSCDSRKERTPGNCHIFKLSWLFEIRHRRSIPLTKSPPPAPNYRVELKSIPISDLCQLEGLAELGGPTWQNTFDDEDSDDRPEIDDRALTLTARHRFLDALAVRNARELVDELPKPGDTLHIRLSGRFSMWTFVPLILDMAAPATIEAMQLHTYSFGKRTVAELMGLTSAGKVKGISVLVSDVFSKQATELYDHARHQLESRGHRIKAIRIHSKIINIRMSDGRCFSVRGSANLRSCNCIEQVELSNSDELYEWDRQLTDILFAREGISDRF